MKSWRDKELTFHLEFDASLPVFPGEAENETYDCARGTPSFISAYRTISAARMAGPGGSDKHTAFKGRINRKDADEEASRG